MKIIFRYFPRAVLILKFTLFAHKRFFRNFAFPKYNYEVKEKGINKNIEASLMRQKMLLRLEYEEEKREFGNIVRSADMSRMVARGNAWWPVRIGQTSYNALNQRTLEIFRTRSENSEEVPEDEKDHNFEHGIRIAFISRGDNSILLTATVSYVDGDRMVAVIPDSADIASLAASHDSIGVAVSFDETSYQAMMEALDKTLRARGRHAELRDLIYSRRPAAELAVSPISISYLNNAQEEGVNKVLRAKDVAIVHGPPGTGKTTTLVEAIHETLRRETQVLVCAQSNMAVDWICSKLSERGLRVLRLGNPSRVSDGMLSNTYERRFADHPDYPTLWSIRKAMRELRAHGKRGREMHQKLDRLMARATELELRINNDLLDSSHVIASTLVGSNHRLLSGRRFSTLFIDEAAQALEAACWIPMRRAGRVILAGDHCQLPPTVKSYEAIKGGLAKSLMETIVENHPESVVMLRTQYRMHEDIMEFSNRWFYHGRMLAAPGVSQRGILALDTPIEWLDTSGIIMPSAEEKENSEIDSDPSFRESLISEGRGRINRDEALLTMIVLQRYVERIGRDRFKAERIDVGVISPYRGQVNYLRHLIKKICFFRGLRKQFSINTVDGFQGQERDVIILSLVRSNSDGRIGFLSDLRRMNVAMTRARMKLIIVGDVPTMTRHRFYRQLHDYIAALR